MLTLPIPLGEHVGFTFIPEGSGHHDLVESVSYNIYGTRMALGAADGRIKVFDKIKDGSWKLCDTWRAHDAEVLELHWVPSTLHPNHLASISYDGKFKLWIENPAAPKGRRFQRSANELRSGSSRGPFLSFSMRHNPETRHTYLALLDRSAHLKLYENDEPENLDNWDLVDDVRVGDAPQLGEENAFKVRFDPNLEPSYNAIREGVPRDSLGVVVATMDKASLWRTKLVFHEVTLGSSTTRELYRAKEFTGHKSLVRDIAWAPGSVRGFDVVATVSKDGYVRVYEVRTPPQKEIQPGAYSKYPAQALQKDRPRGTADGVQRSGIGAGLATTRADSRHHDKSGQVNHEVELVGELDMHNGPVWRCEFDEDGQLLGTCGDDGKVIMWRRKPDGTWAASAELGVAKGLAPNGKEGA